MVLAQNRKYRSIEQDRKSQNKPTHYCHQIYDKGGKNIQWRKTVSSISGGGKTGQFHVKE